MKARKPGLFILLAVVVSLFVGVMSVASQAQTQAHCEASEPATGESSETGGTMVTYVVSCTGNGTLTNTVTAKVLETLLFKAEDTYTVNGNGFFQKAVHLPPSDAVAEICVEVNDEEQCVPPSQ